MAALSEKEQNIVKIASYTAKGDLQNLEKSLNVALDEKLSVNEIKEILVQSYAYCGFPRSLNGVGTFMKVVDSRQGKMMLSVKRAKFCLKIPTNLLMATRFKSS